MKKIILLLLPFFVLALRSTSFAYTAPDGNNYEYYYELTSTNAGQPYYIYCNYPLVCSKEQMSGGDYVVMTGQKLVGSSDYGLLSLSFRQGGSILYVMNVVSGQNVSWNDSDSKVYYSNNQVCPYNWNVVLSAAQLQGTSIELFDTNQEALEYISSGNIDFDSPYYDPLLAVPEVEIKYNMTDNSSGNVPVLPISIKLTNADSGYYVQVAMVNYMPSTVAVKYQDYDALMSHKFQQHNLIPAEMLKISSELSSDDLGDLAVNAWSQDVVSYPISNVIFTNQIGTDSGAAAAYQNMIDLYTNARKVGLFYGNNTELYFRYFYIDDSDKFVVSAWRTWSSAYSNTFGLAMPSYYKTYSSASGYENTDNNTSIVISPTSQPNVVNPSNNYGKKTGSPININIGSNVPNYPDYPTIATYNTDNLLVNALDTAKQLPDFFTSSIAIFNGMFSGLLPEPFWGIVMTGFLFSIVIMIIKVL